MTAVVVMQTNQQPPGLDLQDCKSHSQGEGDCNVNIGEAIDLEKNGKQVSSEVKNEKTGEDVKQIDIEACTVIEKKSDIKNQIASPSKATISNGASNVRHNDFIQENDAPEVSNRVYDFNMVKQKTLPRISFGNTQIFRGFSSHSKSYALMLTIMPISLLICIIILILYFMPH